MSSKVSNIEGLTKSEAKQVIIKAARVAIDELVKVLEEPIIEVANKDSKKADLTADKMKNAAAAKKMAMMDAFEMLDKIEEEENKILADSKAGNGKKASFAEDRVKK